MDTGKIVVSLDSDIIFTRGTGNWESAVCFGKLIVRQVDTELKRIEEDNFHVFFRWKKIALLLYASSAAWN